MSTSGASLLRPDLSAEAIRLARMVHRLLPDEAEVAGLLALMLLTDARRAARSGPGGELVPMAEQDRSRWDRGQVNEGIELVRGVLDRGVAGPYLLQAAIAAVHDDSPSPQGTDWARIEQLYEQLASISDNPVVTLNRAVAVAMARGPAAGLELLAAVEDDRRVAEDHRLHAVRAHLLEMLGQRAAAREAYEAAAARTGNLAQQRYLRARAAGSRLTADDRPPARDAAHLDPDQIRRQPQRRRSRPSGAASPAARVRRGCSRSSCPMPRRCCEPLIAVLNEHVVGCHCGPATCWARRDPLLGRALDTTMIRLAGVFLIGFVLVAACSGSGTPAPPATANPAAVSGGVTVGTATTGLGVVLTGANGLTLYTHAGDTATSSTCTGSCLAAWPPLTVATAQQAAAAPGVNGQLATLVRPEGSIQVPTTGSRCTTGRATRNRATSPVRARPGLAWPWPRAPPRLRGRRARARAATATDRRRRLRESSPTRCSRIRRAALPSLRETRADRSLGLQTRDYEPTPARPV